MEEPIFYQVNTLQKPLPLRRRQALLKKLTQLNRDVTRLERRTCATLNDCQRMGIILPEPPSLCFRRLHTLLKGAQNTLLKK